ncbi:MAG TPA: ribonuclease H-like domain-containing protein [Verrucomicrobiae bacterium]|nr:ribonuclease H-like domain-containing protein [Verrucomicrobiae bacterium]
MGNIVYFDLETQKSAAEVGGWHRKRDMCMSVGVTYATGEGEYHIFGEAHVDDLIRQLMRADLVVGFNIFNFDYEVLTHYTPLDLHQVPTLDLMVDLEKILGHRLSLDAVAKATINAPKVADGMAALRWWKEGRLLDIAEYCCFDVKITKQLHEHGRQYGEVSYIDRLGQKRKVKVKW